MGKPNEWDGFCCECGVEVREGEGWVQADAHSRHGWSITCVEHTSPTLLEAPAPVDASKLPSVHLDERRFER